MSNGQGNRGTLTQQASRGMLWGIIGNLGVSAISFIGTAIMARILSPRDFGLIGMAVLVTGVINLFGNLGLGAALVQKNQINEEYLSTTYWATLGVSVVLFISAAIIAPLAAIFFHETALAGIIVFLAVNFITAAFSSVQTTLLYKQVRLKNIAVIEMVCRVARVFIMLGCAAAGFLYWSIVCGMIGERLLKTVLFCRSVAWRPTLVFSRQKFNELFRFGRNIYGQGLLGYMSRNIDTLITGRLLGSGMVGLYQFSYNLPYLVQSYVQDGLSPAAFSVFSKVNDERPRLARGVLTAVKYVAMLIFPVMTGLSSCARDFLAIVYGAQWLAAAPSLALLCLSAALASVHCLVGTVYHALGRPELLLKWDLARLPLTIGMVILFSRWGIVGIAAAILVMEIVAILVPYWATRLLQVRFSDYMRQLLPAVAGCLAISAWLFVLNRALPAYANVYLRFTACLVSSAALYSGVLFIFFKRDLAGLLEFIKLSVTAKK